MTSRRALVALAAAALVLVAACSGGGDDKQSSPTTSGDSTTPATSTSTSGGTGGLPEGFGDGPPGSGLQRFYDQKVDWQSCDPDDQCGNVWVPLDYSDPNGQAITLALKIQPSTNPSARRGSLFINPGGPGESGIDYLSFIDLPSAVTDAYDVVGWDPRGVGASTPVDCLSDSDLDTYIASDPSPDTPAEVNDFEALWKHYTQGCEDRSGPLLAHVSTVEVARDLDVLRAVVGDAKLNFFGGSYGTYIGATYAGLFPTHVDRMVLDGAIDPLAPPLKTLVDQVAGFQTALTAYLNYCVDQGSCPLGNSVASAQQRLIQLLNGVDSHPLPTASGRDLTEGLAFLGVIFPLYSQSSWDIETQALQAAVDGHGDILLAIADQYANRAADGSYSGNAIEVQNAVNCLDNPMHETTAQIEADAPAFLHASPVFGKVGEWFPYGCSHWPEQPSEEKPDFSAKGAPPIVVVGTTRDPATPYQQAVRLAHELDSGVLLSRDGDGHTAYNRGNSCIDDAINTYFVTGQPPADGTMC